MKHIAIACLGVLLAVTGCDKAPDKPPEPAAEKPAPPEPEKTEAEPTAVAEPETEPVAEPETEPVAEPETEPAAATPQTDEEIAAQCDALLAKSWKASAPAYEKAGIEVTPELEAYYLSRASRFVDGCRKASRAYRDCLAAGDNPAQHIDPCQHASGERETRLELVSIVAPKDAAKYPTTVPSLVTTRPELDGGAGAATLAKLVGTWKRTTPFGETTWTIAADGKVTEREERKGSDPKEQTFTISPATDTSFEIAYENNNQTRGFAMLSDDRFVMEGNLMWMPSALGDGETFVVRNDFDAIFYDEGECQALTAAGSLLPAQCAFEEADGGRVLKVSYQVPGKVKWNTTDPEPTEARFAVYGERLVPVRLLETPFVKQ